MLFAAPRGGIATIKNERISCLQITICLSAKISVGHRREISTQKPIMFVYKTPSWYTIDISTYLW